MTIKKEKNPLITISTYVVWFALIAGAIFLLFSGRAAFTMTLVRYAARGYSERMLVGMLDKAFILSAAILVLGVTVFAESYLSKAKSWTVLAGRLLLCIGIESATLMVITATSQIASRTLLGSFWATATLLLPTAIAVMAFAGSRRLGRGTR